MGANEMRPLICAPVDFIAGKIFSCRRVVIVMVITVLLLAA